MNLRQAQVVVALMLAAVVTPGRVAAEPKPQEAGQTPEGGKPPEAGTASPEQAKPPTAEAAPAPGTAAPQPDKAKEEAAAGDKPKEEAPEAKAEPAADEATKLNVELHAGAYIYLYQPLPRDPPPIDDLKPNMELYFAHVNFDGTMGDFGLHLETRFRDTKLYDYYTSNVWIEEGYAFYNHKYVSVKAGKLYTKLGKFWDNSFYGNIHFYEGLKLDPDLGISGDGSIGEGPGIHLGYALQYFFVDGRTNGSLPGRDIVSVPDARARHSIVARVEPAYYFNDDTSLTLGVSGQYFQADIPDPVGKQNVFRVGADLTFALGPWSIWGEFMRQMGRSVTDYPIATVPATATTMEIPGKASAHNNYLLAGTEVKWWRLQGRYNFSLVDYGDADVKVLEWMSVAGVGFDIHENINLLVEHVYWPRTDGKTATNPEPVTSINDHSLNVSMYAHF